MGKDVDTMYNGVLSGSEKKGFIVRIRTPLSYKVCICSMIIGMELWSVMQMSLPPDANGVVV